MMASYSMASLRRNWRSNLAIALIVLIATFLLSLLCAVFYNFWIDNINQMRAKGQVLSDASVVIVIYVTVVILACLALVAIIHNAFASTMGSRVHQYGILSTIGATPRQIRRFLMQEALIDSAIPLIIGTVAGVAAAAAFINGAISYSASILNPDQEVASSFSYHPMLFVTTLLLALGTVLFSAWMPAHKLAHISPLEAAKGSLEPIPKRKERFQAYRRLFGIEGELALSSLATRRQSLRSATAAIGLSTFIFAVFLGFMTLSQLVNHTNLIEAGRFDELAQSETIWKGYLMMVGSFCAILALIGITSVISQAIGFIHQRRREFARYISVGMTPGKVVKMLTLEALAVVLRPILISLPFILVANLAMQSISRTSLGAFLAAYPYPTVLLYLGAVALAVGLAYGIGAWRILHLNLASTLKDEMLL